jgi:hypothetical protein
LKRRQREKWAFVGFRGCFVLFRLLEAKMRFGSAGPGSDVWEIMVRKGKLSMCPADNRQLSICV